MTFQPQASTLDLSTPDFSTMNSSTLDCYVVKKIHGWMFWGWNVQTLIGSRTFQPRTSQPQAIPPWTFQPQRGFELRNSWLKSLELRSLGLKKPLHIGLALLCITFKIETFVCHSFVVDVLLGWPSCYCTTAWDFMSKWIIVAHFFVYLQLICNH